MPKCKVCNREAEEANYHELHMKAYESSELEHDKWRRALSISWKDYLNEIVKNPLTGIWAKEVVQLIFTEK